MQNNEERIVQPVTRKSILKNNFFQIQNNKKRIDPMLQDMVNIVGNADKKSDGMKLLEEKDLIDLKDKSLSFSKIKEFVLFYFNHNAYVYVMAFITVYSLFADDFRMGFLPISWDTFINVMLIISMVFYGIECFLMSIFKEGYLFSFYFFVDLISTISIIFDVQWFFNPYNTYEDYFEDK